MEISPRYHIIFNREGIDDILVVDDLGNGDKWKNLAGLRYSDYLHKDVFFRSVTAGTLEFVPDAVVHMGACSSTTERNADYLVENNYRFTRTLAECGRFPGMRAFSMQAVPPLMETVVWGFQTKSTFPGFFP